MKALALVLVVFILGVASYVIWQTWLPAQSKAANLISLTTPTTCLLNEQICTATKEHVQISLAFSPRPVPLMKPVKVSLQFTGLNDLDSASLKIEGENMYMGFQEVHLARQTSHGWQGSFSLPICSESEMHWRVTAILNSSQQAYQAKFKLVTQR